MRVGVVFPQTEITADPDALTRYALAAEAAGYAHIEAYDHILGADPAVRPLNGPYTHESLFYEPFLLFAHLAAITSTIEFSTGVIILPQRQTALVAKQASILQVLSRGRFRLGVGIGWNEREYEALDVDFRTRGRRLEEQIELLRRFWTEPLVTFEGEFHSVLAAGLNPMPSSAIPIWMGGGTGRYADRVLDRIGRLADGWIPQPGTPEEVLPQLEQIRAAGAAVGRDLSDLPISVRGAIGRRALEDEVADAVRWLELGISHYSVNTMGAGLASPDDHIRLVEEFMQAYQQASSSEGRS